MPCGLVFLFLLLLCIISNHNRAIIPPTPKFSWFSAPEQVYSQHGEQETQPTQTTFTVWQIKLINNLKHALTGSHNTFIKHVSLVHFTAAAYTVLTDSGRVNTRCISHDVRLLRTFSSGQSSVCSSYYTYNKAYFNSTKIQKVTVKFKSKLLLELIYKSVVSNSRIAAGLKINFQCLLHTTLHNIS